MKVFTFHPYPPFVEEVWSNQQVVFQQVSDLITADPEQPFILLGDLNSTPYSAIFKEHF